MIEAKKLDGYREQLRQLADRLRGDVSTVTEMTRGAAGGQGAGELTNVPMHLGDMGTEEFMKDLNATLLVNEEFLVNEVVAALDRVNAGTFGQCEACSQEIATARLEVLPYARYCVKCAEKTQSGVEVNLNHGRPQGPRDTLQPEGEMGEYRRATKNSDFASCVLMNHKKNSPTTVTLPGLRVVEPRSVVWQERTQVMVNRLSVTCKKRWAAASLRCAMLATMSPIHHAQVVAVVR